MPVAARPWSVLRCRLAAQVRVVVVFNNGPRTQSRIPPATVENLVAATAAPRTGTLRQAAILLAKPSTHFYWVGLAWDLFLPENCRV